MIISIHDIGRNGRGTHYEWLRANAGGEIYSPDLEYGRCSPLATFERLRSRLSMYEKTTPEGEPVRIVGFGYGGFYAHLLHAGRYNIQTVLVDPLLIPFAPIRFSASPADMEALAKLMTDGFFDYEYGFKENLHVICTGGRDGGAFEEQIRCVLPPSFKHFYRVRDAGDLNGAAGKILKKLLKTAPVKITPIDFLSVAIPEEDLNI